MRKAIILLISLILISCNFDEDIKIKYVVEGDGLFTITFQDENKETIHIQQIASGWTYEFTVAEQDYLHLSAWRGPEAGVVKVLIYKNGNILKQAESSGAYAIAFISAYL